MNTDDEERKNMGTADWRAAVLRRRGNAGFLITSTTPSGTNMDIQDEQDNLEHLPPEQLVESIMEKEKRILEIMREIKALLAEGPKS